MKILLLLAALGLSTVCVAKKIETEALIASCTNFEDSARAMMRYRQEGITLEDILETKALRRSVALRRIIKDAYSKPLWHSKVNKQKEIEAFSQEYYLICLQKNTLS